MMNEAYPMSKVDAEELFTMGMESLKNGDTGAALDSLEKAVIQERNPLYCSNLAICLAKEKRDFKRALSLCNEAIKKDPKNSLHFLNLGRVHLMANQKKDAIRIFNMGLRYGENRDIIAELKRFDRRRPPPIPFLNRNNPVNKFLGKLTYRLGLR
jgi:tetratricopeptide (TPR) repeat protein